MRVGKNGRYLYLVRRRNKFTSLALRKKAKKTLGACLMRLECKLNQETIFKAKFRGVIVLKTLPINTVTNF